MVTPVSLHSCFPTEDDRELATVKWGDQAGNTVQWLSTGVVGLLYDCFVSFSTLSLSHSPLCAHLILLSSGLGNPSVLARLTAPYFRLLKNLDALCRARVSALCQAQPGLVYKPCIKSLPSHSVCPFQAWIRRGWGYEALRTASTMSLLG